MTKEQLAALIEKRAEKEYPVYPELWSTIPCPNDLALAKRKAMTAGANLLAEPLLKALRALEAIKEPYEQDRPETFETALRHDEHEARCALAEIEAMLSEGK